MKFQYYIKRFPALTLLVMLLGAGIFLSSCEDDEIVSDEVVLESFGPSGVKHGETIKFIGQNLDKVTAIELPGAEVSKSQFSSQTSGLIELEVPREAQAGKVTLKTPKGDIVSKAMLSFEVPVVINSITAEARPGSDITITGEMVNWIEEVVFNDGLSVTEFVSSSLNELVVTVPMEAQTGALIFRSGGTEPLSFASEDELIVTLPVVNSLSHSAIRHADNLTISGSDLDLVTSVVFPGDTVNEFVSQSASEIVLAVPAQAVKGVLTLQQASPVDVVTSEELTIILPVGTEVMPKPAVPGVDDITITGTDLDLIAALELPSVGEIQASEFKSQTATEIVLTLPEGTAAGGIKYTTIHGYSNNLGVTVIVPGEGPAPLPIALYDEAIENDGGDWSWSGASDPGSTEQFYSGNISWKFETTEGGGLSAGGMTAVDASGQGVFTFALFGGAGTDGAEVAVVLNDDWSNIVTVILEEGKWTEYQIPLGDFGSVDMSAITRFAFKVEGITSSVIYADRVGFDAGGPAPLLRAIYDDAAQNGFGEWGGWGATSEFNSTERVREGSAAIKVTYAGGWGGGAQFGGGNISTEGATNFVFSMYGEPGTGGNQIKVLIKSDAGEHEKMIDIVEGEWVDVEIPLSELGDAANINELFFQDADFSGVVHFDYIGIR